MIKLIELLHRHKIATVFLILTLACLATLTSAAFRRYVIFSNYNDPPPILLSSIIFEYLAFALIAIIFPLSLRITSTGRLMKAGSIVFTAILFVIMYTSFLSLIEWLESGMNYDLIQGLGFTMIHSGPFTLAIYIIIALAIYFSGAVPRIKHSDQYLKAIYVREKNKTVILPLNEVDFFESDGNYVVVHHQAGSKHLLRERIKNLEKCLDPDMFVRIHRKYIINTSTVLSYEVSPKGGYIINMNHSKSVRMSRNYHNKLALLKK